MAAHRTRVDPAHIVILGPSKTGTTGVYTSVKDGLRLAGIDAITVFEPNRAGILDSLFTLAPFRTVMTKTTMNAVEDVLPDPLVFERRVMTVRDPRDILISSLLFRPITRRSLERTDDAAIEQFVAALERKEANPASLSLRELFDLAAKLRIGAPPYAGTAQSLNTQLALREKYSFHVVRYEDFVAGELNGLSEYLGFPVENRSDEGSSMFGHISRSKTSGDYVNWFTADDVEYFDGLFGDALEALGYDRKGELAAQPHIDPEVSSRYVRTRYLERRDNLRAAAEGRSDRWDVAEVDANELSRLTGFAQDGDPVACLRVAQVARHGQLGRDEASALHWARTAAQFGSRDGMRLVIELLEQLEADDAAADPVLHRELRIWRHEYQSRFSRVSTLNTKVAALQTELAESKAQLAQARSRHLPNRLRAIARRGRDAAQRARAARGGSD